MDERNEMIALLADRETSPPLMKFLGKTRADLEAMTEDELRGLMSPAATFLHEVGTLQGRAADIMAAYAQARGPCEVSNLAHRAQRLRDLGEEFDRIQRRLREHYGVDCGLRWRAR